MALAIRLIAFPAVGFVLLITAALLSGLLAAPPATAAGAATATATTPAAKKPVVTFGTQTATAAGPDRRGIFQFGASPGGLIQDHVAVINYSLQPVTLFVGAADALNTPQGGFALRPPNQQSTDVGHWVYFPQSDVTLNMPARTTVIVPFEVKVPVNATPGDHIGGITATLQSYVKSKSGQDVRLLQSVGTRLFLRVSGPLRPSLQVSDVSVSYSDPLDPVTTGTAVVHYRVRNTGNVALGGRPAVSVTGLLGTKSIAKRLPDIQLLLPGDSVIQTAKVKGVYPEIRDKAKITVQSLIIPGTVQPGSGPFVATRSFWAIPWLLLVVVVILLGGAGWLVRRRRRPSSGAAGDSPAATGPESIGRDGHETDPSQDRDGSLRLPVPGGVPSEAVTGRTSDEL